MVVDNYIDWSKISSLDDVQRLDRHILYDESKVRSKSPLEILALKPDLTLEEREDAYFWKDFISGLMLVTGEKGGGKGIFIHMLAYKMRYYFDKIVISDTRPRESFGAYTPFSFPMLVEMLDRMDEVEKGIPHPIIIDGLRRSDFDDKESYEIYKDLPEDSKIIVMRDKGKIPLNATLKSYDSQRNEWCFIPNFKPRIDNETGKWLSSRGEVFFVNSVAILDEVGSKYAPRKKPNLSTAVSIISLCDYTRHLRSLVLAAGVSLEDFNLELLDKATWEAKCVQMDNINYRWSDNPDDLIFKIYIDQIKFNPVTGSVQKAIGKTNILLINASEPRHMLKGLAIKDIYNTENAQGILIPKSMRRIQ